MAINFEGLLPWQFLLQYKKYLRYCSQPQPNSFFLFCKSWLVTKLIPAIFKLLWRSFRACYLCRMMLLPFKSYLMCFNVLFLSLSVS